MSYTIAADRNTIQQIATDFNVPLEYMAENLAEIGGLISSSCLKSDALLQFAGAIE